jgi:Fic family protein
LTYLYPAVENLNSLKNTDIFTEEYFVLLYRKIKQANDGIRPEFNNTVIKQGGSGPNAGKVIYTPPRGTEVINSKLRNLIEFVNDDEKYKMDHLLKMSIAQYQFEVIHPFRDGNGRTGRIINILYLVKEGLLDLPILYLSRFINQNKSDYYRLLQKVRTDNAWEEWVLYMLDGVEQTSLQTIKIIEGIKNQMKSHKERIRTELPKIYSQDLLNNLFRHPYTKIDFVMEETRVSRKTAAKYLDALDKLGIVSKQKICKDNYYINTDLFALLQNVSKL